MLVFLLQYKDSDSLETEVLKIVPELCLMGERGTFLLDVPLFLCWANIFFCQSSLSDDTSTRTGTGISKFEFF